MAAREAAQRHEPSNAKSPAMETQDDSVDLTYLKQAALEIGDVRFTSSFVILRFHYS